MQKSCLITVFNTKNTSLDGNLSLQITQHDENTVDINLPWETFLQLTEEFHNLVKREKLFLVDITFYNVNFNLVELTDSSTFKDLKEPSILDTDESNIYKFIFFRKCFIKNLKIYVEQDSTHRYGFTFSSKFPEHKNLNSTVIKVSYDCIGGHGEITRTSSALEIEDLECKIIELRQSNPVTLKNCHFSTINHLKLSNQATINIFSPSIGKISDEELAILDEDNSIKTALDSAIYTLKNVYSAQSSRDSLNYNIEVLRSNLESSNALRLIRLGLLKFHGGYFQLLNPALAALTLIMSLILLITCFNLNPEIFIPTKVLSYLVEDLSFHNPFSWIKIILMPINLLLVYSLFCFFAALKKRLGFKKP